MLTNRLEAFVFRIRALCVALHGYDPEMENFDQTPYHANESGSQNAKTLAVAGEKVPLIEGHADTRVRWTANLITFSNAERIHSGDIPYCEFMFKHDIKGEQSSLELRLREHIRSRGYGPWVSVATSNSGSYAQDDVLNFLDKHLPHGRPQSRKPYWRIMFADDFAAHKVGAVRRLCWQRGYVLIVLPGGATPVVQTCDTDLNQHVRREYIALETLELLAGFQRGEIIPKLKPEQMIDTMVEVWSKEAIHLRAAAGYKKTAVAVSVDDAGEDMEITREAADFWRELGMRQKVDAEVAAVRAEADAGRLTWTYQHILHLMMPYPQSKEEDKLLALSHDAGYCELADERRLDTLGGSDTKDQESDADASSSETEAGEDVQIAVAESTPLIVPQLRDAGPQSRAEEIQLPRATAEAFEACHSNLKCLEAVNKELRDNGMMRVAHNVTRAIQEERRRMRLLGGKTRKWPSRWMTASDGKKS